MKDIHPETLTVNGFTEAAHKHDNIQGYYQDSVKYR